MADGKPVPETSASETGSTAKGSPLPAKAEGADSTTPPIKMKPWRIGVSAIGMIGLVLSVILLITSPGTREGTAALAVLIFLSAAVIVGALKPYWERWKPAKQIGGVFGAAAAATVVFLALLQVLPTNSTAPTPTPPTATVSTPPSTSSPVFVVRYIDKTGYIDLDGMKVYDGGEDAPIDDVDIAVYPEGCFIPRNAAGISPSKSGGKETCEQAIAQDTPDDISMRQAEVDKGFCAYSRGGRYAYVELLRLTYEEYNHVFIQVRLSVYP